MQRVKKFTLPNPFQEFGECVPACYCVSLERERHNIKETASRTRKIRRRNNFRTAAAQITWMDTKPVETGEGGSQRKLFENKIQPSKCRIKKIKIKSSKMARQS